MTRSQARGPWMLMEQAAGPVNWRGVNHPKPRGLNRLWSLQAVARGADAVCYFQWRQSRQGAEKFHSGMVSHAGEEGRTYQEVKRLGADLERIAPEVTAGTSRRTSPSCTTGTPGAGAHDGRLSSRVEYPEVLRAWHRALWQAHLTTDFAHPEHDLTTYSMVVVPQLYALTDAAVDNLLSYARGGGTLVCGFLTGVADEDDRVRPGGMTPGCASCSASARCTSGGRWTRGRRSPAKASGAPCGPRNWSRTAPPTRPSPTRVANSTACRRPAQGPGLVRLHPFEPEALRDLLASIAAGVGVRPVLDDLPEQVEAVRRGEVLFVLNHGREPVTVEVPGTHHDLLSGTDVTDRVTLGRYEAAVLRP